MPFRPARLRHASFLTVLAALVACEPSSDNLLSPAQPRGATTSVSTRSTARRPDEERVRAIIADEPAIAGFFIDSSGSLVVNVTDSTRFASARSVLARHLADGHLLPPAFASKPILARRVNYTFEQLSQWRDIVSDSLLGRDGVVMVDLDEKANVVGIRVDIAYAGGRQPLLDDLRRFAIPSAAVSIELGHPAELARSTRMASSDPLSGTYRLDSNFGTLAGGLKIETWNDATQAVYGDCSIGLVVERNGVPGFLTASHCTPTMYSVDSNISFYQATHQFGTRVGYEAVDPNLGNPLSRGSDASFDTIPSTVASARGYIYRPQARVSGGPGTVVIDTLNPSIPVTAAETYVATSGLTLDKVGVTSGWTTGSIFKTCVDVYFTRPQGTTRVQCISSTQTYGAQGDSGGPVFYWVMGPLPSQATFYGLVTALDCLSPGCTSAPTIFFTQWTSIQADLGGTWTVTAP